MSRWQGATVLITGATGFLGRNLLRHCLKDLGVAKVRVYSRDEQKQHLLRQRWPDVGPGAQTSFVIGDVRDKDRLTWACRDVAIVVHTASLKRIEGSATHARELVKTNVLGTANVIDAALANQVPWTLFISSDKGCLPVNGYGKTKALAEDLILEGNAWAGGLPVRFASVRYGNVLGSTGSVLSLWQQAHDQGNPLPITDDAMTRFWITVQGACRFIARSVDRMQGGETFVPQMAHSTVTALATAAFPGTELVLIGERPGGEKLHETLIGTDELRHTIFTPQESSWVICPQLVTWDQRYQYPTGVPIHVSQITSQDAPQATPGELCRLLTEAGWPGLSGSLGAAGGSGA